MIGRQPPGHERPSVRWVAAGLVVALLAALGGWFVADRIAADPAAVSSVSMELRAGPARLKDSTDWAEVRSPPILPGLAGAPAWTPYSGLETTVSVALVPASDAALMPSDMVEHLGGALPRPEKARVVGLEARAYRGVRSGESVLDVYAIPTTRGVLTLVCRARSGASEAPTWCLNGLDSITVTGAQPLKPAADTAYRLRAPATLKALDKVRVSQRKALRRAKGPVGQQRTAMRLYGAHMAAVEELAPLAPAKSAPERLVTSLRATARAYRALASAADRRSKRAWARARSDIARAERTLKKRVAST